MSAFLDNSTARFIVGDLDSAKIWSSNKGTTLKKYVYPGFSFSYKKIRLRKEGNTFYVELALELLYEVKADFKNLSEAEKYYDKLYDIYFKGL